MCFIRTMSVMARRALHFHRFVDRVPEYILYIMAIQTKFFRFRNKQILITGEMRLMADLTAAGCQGPVYVLFLHVKDVAVQAELVFWDNENIASGHMAPIALFCSIRPMFKSSFPLWNFCLLFHFPFFHLRFYRVGHPIEEETHHRIPGLFPASAEQENTQ